VDNRLPPERDAEVLPDKVAERLLARASELDAAHAAGAPVADLRAAAAEAGISAGAFDAALAELQGASQGRVSAVSSQPLRRRWRTRAAWIAALILAGTFAVIRSRTPTGATAGTAAPMIEETIVLRCLSPEEAAELVRPLLSLRSNTLVISPARASRVLTIRATPAQIQNVRSVLDQNEGPESPACATRRPGANP
jgi:hypothetical protein